MIMPKKVKRYCPKCKAHTEHKVTKVKGTRKRATLKKGQRRHERRAGVSGYGGYPRPKPEHSKRWSVKMTKKVDLRYKCDKCGKSTARKEGFRIKKLEFERA